MQVRGPGRLAIVGGVVRDALLYHTEQDPIQASKDLDLVLEGSCFELASNLQNTLGDLRVTDLRVHDQFGTVELVLDGVNIDLATARTEIYPAPGQNPLVNGSSLERDLSRRDFTVNAMALVLKSDGSLHLLDPHGGQEHIAMRPARFPQSRKC